MALTAGRPSAVVAGGTRPAEKVRAEAEDALQRVLRCQDGQAAHGTGDNKDRRLKQGTLTKGEDSVQLTSS